MKPREFLQVDPASLGTFSGEGVRRGQLCATAVSAVGDRSRARTEGYARTADTAVAHELSASLPFLATTLRKSLPCFSAHSGPVFAFCGPRRARKSYSRLLPASPAGR